MLSARTAGYATTAHCLSSASRSRHQQFTRESSDNSSISPRGTINDLSTSLATVTAPIGFCSNPFNYVMLSILIDFLFQCYFYVSWCCRFSKATLRILARFPVTNMFEECIVATIVRIVPVAYKYGVALRLELLGCYNEVE